MLLLNKLSNNCRWFEVKKILLVLPVCKTFLSVLVLNCGCRTIWNWDWRGQWAPKLPEDQNSAIRFITFARPSLFMAASCTRCFLSGCRSAPNKIRRFPLISGWGTFLTQNKDLFHRRFLELISCCCTCVLLLGHPFPPLSFSSSAQCTHRSFLGLWSLGLNS